MVKRARRNRPARLLNSRWPAYATAAAASAFGAGAAEAEIHYSGVVRQNILNRGGFAAATFPLSHGASFQLGNFSAVGLYNTARFAILGAAVSHAVRAHPPIYFAYSVSRLTTDVPVSQGNFYQTSSPMQGTSAAIMAEGTGLMVVRDMLASNSIPAPGRNTDGCRSRSHRLSGSRW